MLIALHDGTIRPGATYRYSLQYKLANPLFNRPPDKAQNPAWVEQLALVSPMSDANKSAVINPHGPPPTIPTAGSELICFDHGYPKSKKPSHKCNREQRGKPTADGRRFTRIGIHLRLFLRSFAAIIVLPLETKQIRRTRVFRGIQPDAPIHPRPRGRARMDRFPRTST